MQTIATTAPVESDNRYVFIDALRGIAALAVLWHHLLHNTVMGVLARRILPKFLTVASDYGGLGVQVFFVLSGFVIAHSLRGNQLTRQSIGNFILRRQIRLDPPYWFMLLITLLLQYLKLSMSRLITPPMPNVSAVLLNFLYLPGIARVSIILGVAWTLCIEIQFYLAFITLLVIGKVLAKALQRSQVGISALLIFLSGILSLAVIHFGDYPAWFIQFWFSFSAGVLCNWCLKKVISTQLFLAFLVFFALSIVASFLIHIVERNVLGIGIMVSGTGMIAGFLTVLSIYIVGSKGHLTDWWNNSLLQYFGRISYSLYLVHVTALEIVCAVGYKVTGENKKMAVIWCIISALISIACAHLLFLVIERPSMRLAGRFKIRPKIS